MAAITPPAWTTGLEAAEIAVANLALVRIGADPIRDTTENTPSSRQTCAVFAATRDELLRDYEFNFAQKRILLDHDDAYTGPMGPWTYVYIVPASPVILKVIDIGGDRDNTFQVMGDGTNRRLFCDLVSVEGTPDQLEIRYVEQVANPASWDSLFRDALVLRIASKIAVPLLKQPEIAQFLQGEFASIVAAARAASSKEYAPDEGEELWTERKRGRSWH